MALADDSPAAVRPPVAAPLAPSDAPPDCRARLETWLSREWQRSRAWKISLTPVSWLFASIVSLRRLLFRSGVYRSTRIDVPVIVVGNITVGGSGKTPLVIAIVEMLRAHGYRPGVVSRGYGSTANANRDDRAVQIDAAASDAALRFGDEPVLLARRLHCPVVVARDRVAAARTLRVRNPEVDVIVSDDGLQHYALARDIEIAVLDGGYGVGNGAMLPAGPLREPVSRLNFVDAMAMYGLSSQFDALTPPKFSVALGEERVVNLHGGQQLSVAEFAAAADAAGKSLHAFAGIARPQRFFAHLQRLGLRTHNHSFADHHRFTADDLAASANDLLLMTEKDAVKCAVFADARCWYLRIDAILPPAFQDLIVQRLASAKPQSSTRKQP